MDQVNIEKTISPQVRYAGFWIRFVALIIDSVVVTFCTFFVSFAFGIISPTLNISQILIYLLSFAINIFVSWLYFILMTDLKGATLGKMAVGLKVVSVDGSKLPIGRIIIRETIGKIFSMIPLMLGYVMAGLSSRKQALHDKIVNSIVVYK